MDPRPSSDVVAADVVGRKIVDIEPSFMRSRLGVVGLPAPPRSFGPRTWSRDLGIWEKLLGHLSAGEYGELKPPAPELAVSIRRYGNPCTCNKPRVCKKGAQEGAERVRKGIPALRRTSEVLSFCPHGGARRIGGRTES